MELSHSPISLYPHWTPAFLWYHSETFCLHNITGRKLNESCENESINQLVQQVNLSPTIFIID